MPLEGGQSINVTAEEGDGRYALVIGPSGDAARSSSWRTVELLPRTSISAVPDEPPAICLEYTALADLDGDGRPDVIGAQGAELGEGNEPGIWIFWRPPAASVADPNAWADAGRIPSTVDLGHFERVEAADLDGDGAPDLVAGGRTPTPRADTRGSAGSKHPRNRPAAGISPRGSGTPSTPANRAATASPSRI